jgi:DNA-binding MarR family transcriptional regulator
MILDLTKSEIKIIAIIYFLTKKHERMVFLDEIKEKSGTSKGWIIKVINSLRKKRLIYQPKDQRHSRIKLTRAAQTWAENQINKGGQRNGKLTDNAF